MILILFFKNRIRDGINQCTQRKHEANNQFKTKHNPNKRKSSFLNYFDERNLFGYSKSVRFSIVVLHGYEKNKYRLLITKVLPETVTTVFFSRLTFITQRVCILIFLF